MKLNRSFVLLILAGLLPVAVLAAAMGASALRQQQDAMQREALERVNLVSTVLERELTAQIDLVRAIAAAKSLDQPADLDRFAVFANRVRRTQPLWFSVVLSNPAGDRLRVVTDLPIGQTGKVADLESHQRVVATGKPAIGRIRGSNSPTGRPAFAIRAPVIRDGKVIYVVTVILQPKNIRDLLFGVGVPKDWVAAVVDDQGRFVARTAGPPTMVGTLASRYLRDANARAPSGVYEGVTLEGLHNVTAYKVLPEWGWSVHLAIPWDIYQAPLRSALALQIASAALGLALAALFAWLLWRELRLRQRDEAAIEETRRMEAMGRMTGGVAHDFNNLLMIVQGSAELLKRRKDDPARIDAYSDAILTAAQRGQALTRQLLAFARRSSHEPVSFDLKDRTGDILALLDRSTRPAIETTFEVQDGTWPVRADPGALEIALINLAVNAGDAMPEGGRITVAAANVGFKTRDAGTGLTGDYVALSVSDTGAGIAPEHLAQIFEPFFTTKAPGKGTGLGLSQVYGFAKQSGGAVAVTSKPGAGATFTLYLPRSKTPAASPVRATEPAPQRGDGRLLLVEDNTALAEVTQEMLSTEGYAVTWTPSATAALDLIAGAAPAFDIVLSDVVLDTGMSGLEMAERLRRERPALPVVLMTGYSEALAGGSGRGFTVLAKPFGQAGLAAALLAERRKVAKAAE